MSPAKSWKKIFCSRLKCAPLIHVYWTRCHSPRPQEHAFRSADCSAIPNRPLSSHVRHALKSLDLTLRTC
jgi:hypothetical protein